MPDLWDDKIKWPLYDTEEHVSIPLQRAALCLDCERVFNLSREGASCPKCGSALFHLLSKFIAARVSPP